MYEGFIADVNGQLRPMPPDGDQHPGRQAVAIPPLGKRRRKLWEIPHKYHCPIIGTCLNVSELRRLAARFSWPKQERPTDYEIHVSFVAAADDHNSLSLLTHKLLEKKYAAIVKRFSRARTTEELLTLWTEALGAGEVQGALWAVMTHPRTDAAGMALVYEEVHMISHQIGAGQRADLKALSAARQELARLKHDCATQQRRAREQADGRERKIARLSERLAQAERECEQLRERERHLSERLQTSGVEAYQQRLAECEARIVQLEAALSASESRTTTWREKHTQTQTECEQYARLAEERAAACEALERLFLQSNAASCEDCPNPHCPQRADLGGRLVLCVGGRKPLIEQYRRLVTGCNGRFDHHDGGLEDNQRRLETMLASADAVVCAADCVSHDAYYRTKRFCKRCEKPHVLLGSSGVSAFARALEQVANAAVPRSH